MSGPPRGPERLLRWLMPPDQRDAGMGDAAEEWAVRVVRDGEPAARRWYRMQAWRSVVPGVRHKLRIFATRTGKPTGGEMMTTWLKDIRLAFRMLRRRPGFAFTVLVTLALGIGANTALFSIFRTVFLEPIPLPHSDRLVILEEKGGFGCCGPSSGPDFQDWKDRNRAFSGIAALNPGTFTLSGTSEPQRVQGTYVTASAFQLLGVDAFMGRALVPEDQDAESAVVLSYALWKNELGAPPDIVGTSLEVDGSPYTVVGVMPEGFDVPSPWAHMGDYQLYLPFQSRWLTGNRGNHGYPVIARLAPNATKESAQADMDRIMRELAQEYPRTNGDRGSRVSTVHEYLFGNVGRQLGLILGAAALVLLVACGNVAGLLLARAAARETELSVRAALGASRRSLVRLLFSDSLVLAALGGLLGVLFSVVALDGLKAVLPSTIPRIGLVHIDGWALLFAVGASAFTAFAFGMLPSLVAARGNLAGKVKEGGYSTPAPSRERLRSAFIVGQIALGLVLANGAMLLVRSYANLRGQAYGFRPDGVLTMSLTPAGPRYQKGEDMQAYYDQVREHVAAVPGVTGVATISRLPLYGGSNGNVWVEGRPPRTHAGEGPLVEVTSITGDYFEAMGIPLIKGRLLQPDDTITGSIGVIVNEHLANEVWPGQDPIGKRYSFSDSVPNWHTVVGVVGDIREWGPEQAPVGQEYVPFIQGWSPAQYLIVHASGDPAALTSPVRKAVLEVDPTQPPTTVRTMTALVDRTFAQRRFYTTLIGLFAVAALLLAAAGTYGTVSYFVARRVRELGIRVALGAARSGIVGLVVRRGVRLAVWGIAFGLVGVWATTSVVRGLVYGIKPVDLLTLAAGALVLGLVAVAASALPALRAVRVSPVLALRSE